MGKSRGRNILIVMDCLCLNLGYETKTAQRLQAVARIFGVSTRLLHPDSLGSLVSTWRNAKTAFISMKIFYHDFLTCLVHCLSLNAAYDVWLRSEARGDTQLNMDKLRENRNIESGV